MKDTYASAKPFKLLRSFALLSLLSIGVTTGVSALVLLSFLSEQVLERDAAVTMEFIQNIVETVDHDTSFSLVKILRTAEGFGGLFEGIAHMPDVVRANVYGPTRTVVWSSNPDLVGRNFGYNPELEQALQGRLMVELTNVHEHKKSEHVLFPDGTADVVENYIPIWNGAGDEVLGVAEVYKVPRGLSQVLERGRWLILATGVASALFLYVTLFGIVGRASTVMRAQQERLVATETIATVGEMASAVAHGIRNPLASIRSSAELVKEDDRPDIRQQAAQDVILEVDRLDHWVRDLLLFAQPERGDFTKVDLAEVVRDSVDGFSRTMEKQGVAVVLDLQQTIPPVRGDSVFLTQMFNNLIANALESMPRGGTITIGLRAAHRGRYVDLAITDTGQGIPKHLFAEVFKPFFTNRRGGLGLGLMLVRRIVERHAGQIALSSREGQGTTVSLQFPTVRE